MSKQYAHYRVIEDTKPTLPNLNKFVQHLDNKTKPSKGIYYEHFINDFQITNNALTNKIYNAVVEYEHYKGDKE